MGRSSTNSITAPMSPTMIAVATMPPQNPSPPPTFVAKVQAM